MSKQVVADDMPEPGPIGAVPVSLLARQDAGNGTAAKTSGDEESELFAWVTEICGGRIARAAQTSGGNRCKSWAIDIDRGGERPDEVFLRYGPPRPPGVEPYTVAREAQVYRAVAKSGIRAPRLISEHPRIQAVLTERAHGIAEFRRLKDAEVKQAIAREFVENLAGLHRMPVIGVKLNGGVEGGRIIDHVRAELAIWRAMYDETGRPDPLLDLAFGWLDANMPDPDGPVVLVHGDAGPGNFLFENGHLTALIDWELAHLGDPMEDVAWYSMRCVMEPVPDFAASLAEYERAAGTAIDRQRVLYHRVFVSARVVVIRHRNVTGEPAHAIVSRGLNRRLLVEALAAASRIAIPEVTPLDAPQTPNEELFAHVLDDLRSVVVARSTDSQVIAKAKNAAKVIKYLKESERLGPSVRAANLADLAALLGKEPDTVESGQAELAAALAAGRVSFEAVLGFFAAQTAREAQLAASASGGIAGRHYPLL